MCHNSKFLETSPLEHFYVVVKHILKSAWVILQVVFEAQLKTPDFTQNLMKSKQWTSACCTRASGYRHLSHYIMSSLY